MTIYPRQPASRDGQTETNPRVFVSSVMENFAEYREAAALGIRRAGCEPVRAEDFPAQSTSPRTACLDGVRSADALVLILGERYGFVGPSGLAATEEEYQEALKNGKPILAFIQSGVVDDPRQRSLITNVQNYVDGHWRKAFRASVELAELVEDAVRAADLEAGPLQGSQAAAMRVSSELTEDLPSAADALVLRTVWATLRNEEVIDPLELDDGEFERVLLRIGHECVPPVFDYACSKRSSVETSRIRIIQGDIENWGGTEHFAAVEISVQGTMVVTQSVTGADDRRDTFDHYLSAHVIDPNVLQAQMKQAWAFVAGWWRERDPYLRHNSLLYNVGIYNIGHRVFGPPPRVGEPITMPLVPLDGPLIAFDSPRTVSRTSLDASDDEVARAISLIERRFRQLHDRWQR